MIASERWRDNWRTVAPPGAVRVELPRSVTARAEATARIRDLPAGSPVVLVARAPWAAVRCGRTAAAARVELERVYLAFPGAAAPAYLVEDARSALRFFVQTLLVPPPRAASPVLRALVRLLRVLDHLRLVRPLAPGRVAVGRKR